MSIQKRSAFQVLTVVAIGLAASHPAMAAIDVSSAVTSVTTDGTAAITAVGLGLISLAGVALVIRWAKAMFF